ncbi:unnamed protein product [Meloidogyne enterolobii]|uniref:Uncharacterized protein n=1 Tax=Meloidogyne enterolobii TaxID=390850 RepID=A0ACB0YH98_MELEN
MIAVRFWLQQLFNCVFEYAEFQNVIFNPEMINLLFDNDKTILKQFHVKELLINLNNNIEIENILNFALNHSIIYVHLGIRFDPDNIENYTNILFNIIINEGNKLPEVSFGYYKFPGLYDLLVEYITKSKDFSKMVTSTRLVYNSYRDLPISEKAKNIKTGEIFFTKYAKYQIVNIYNPEVKFSFLIRTKCAVTIFISLKGKIKVAIALYDFSN